MNGLSMRPSLIDGDARMWRSFAILGLLYRNHNFGFQTYL